MAKTVTRKGTATRGAKADARKTADKATDSNDDDEAKAAAKAEAEAAEAARQEKLQDLKGRLADASHDLTQADQSNAIEMRMQWVKIGETLIEGRNLFMKEGSNNVNDKAFGKWIAENGLTVVGNRPSRAGAIWLAEVYNKKPDLYNLFPTESVDGEPLRRSPRTLQSWVREHLYALFQDAYESRADDIGVASEAEKEHKEDVARAAMPNVYEALTEQMEIASDNAEAAEKKIKAAKNAADRKAAMADYEGKAEVLDTLQLRKAILDQHTDEERLALFIGWKPKRETVSFKDCEVDEAAARLFALLKSHEGFVDVYDALGGLVEELANKVDADAAGVDDDEPNGASDDHDAVDEDEEDDIAADDFEEDEEDFDGDDFEEDEEDEE